MPTKLPTGSPVLPPDSLFYLLSEIPEEKRESLKAKLATASRQEVLKLYRQNLWKSNRKQVWLLAEELTRRGIPPSFRPSPWVDEEPRIPLEDVFLLDLQWLAHRYPGHRTSFVRWRRLFRPGHFEKTAGFMLVYGRKEPGYYLKGLALAEDQQVECIYLRGAAVRSRMTKIENLTDVALERIKIAHMANRRARAQGEPVATIERRQAIWRCGSMGDWMPTRTAELYEALTGEPITRQLAWNVIEEVWEAFPISKPPAKKRRRTRPKLLTVATPARSKTSRGKRRRKTTTNAAG